MKVSAEVEIACSLAQSEAARRRHDLITVEHLLYALLHDDATARVVRGAGGNVDRLKKEIDRVLDFVVRSGRTAIALIAVAIVVYFAVKWWRRRTSIKASG